MEATLKMRIKTMEDILSITGQPGMSIGVIHQGEEVFKHNFGFSNIERSQETNSDTLYCIASLSKAFMAASLDLLVQEWQLLWDDTMGSIFRDFKFLLSNGLASMTVRDICSHRTGLLSLDEIIQGLDARILVPKEDVLEACGRLPAKYKPRTKFLYNNALYELAGRIVEVKSGYVRWGRYQQAKIFTPLKMERTTAERSIHYSDDNIATPYMILSDGTPSEIEPTELSDSSMNGGSGGIRSSVNDLLKWCHCLLASFDEAEVPGKVVRQGSPIFERMTIANPQSAEDGDYCAGWCYHRTPAKLGMISPNRTLESPTLGKSSPSVVLYGHQGDVPGYTSNLYIIPETKSALVILSNGTGLSDATDWIAQDLIQTMYGLQPPVDFVDVARKARAKYISHFDLDFVAPLRLHQTLKTPSPPHDELVGTYVMPNTAAINDAIDVIRLDIIHNPKNQDELLMVINGHERQAFKLWHYHWDVFCHLPSSADECISRGLDRTDWSSFLIYFERDPWPPSDPVDDPMGNPVFVKLRWKLDGVDVRFFREIFT